MFCIFWSVSLFTDNFYSSQREIQVFGNRNYLKHRSLRNFVRNEKNCMEASHKYLLKKKEKMNWREIIHVSSSTLEREENFYTVVGIQYVISFWEFTRLFGDHVRCHMTETNSRLLFVFALWTVMILSLTLPENGKATWLYYPHLSSFFPFFTPSTYCLLMEQYVYNSTRVFVCVFFPCKATYVYKMLNVLHV